MKLFFYLLVLTLLAPVVIFGSMIQASILRMEKELKILKQEYVYQFERLAKK